MNGKYLLFLLGISLGVVSVNAANIKVSVSNAVDMNKVVLTFSDNLKKEILLDSDGKGSLEVDEFVPQYVQLHYGDNSRLLYLEPKMNLSIAFDGKTLWKEISFTGEGAEINDYLNVSKLRQITFNDAKLEEEAFIYKADSLYQSNIEQLNLAKLPIDFVDIEKKRLKYFSYSNFPLYTIFYAYLHKLDTFKASDNYYKHLEEIVEFNPKLLQLTEYKSFLLNAISALGVKGEKYNMFDLLKMQLSYVEANVKNPVVREYLIYTVTYNYVKSNGIDDALLAIDAFRKYVKEPEMVDKFTNLCELWKKIACGQPSPEFSAEDINGKIVQLNDLKGKFIYIDVWATWCGPCRKELPYLKKMEEQFRNKDIEFVSLSCDKNKEAWKKMVVKENLKGFQLYLGNKSDFMNEYQISGIPRFILLDKESKIISANMTRPSDEATINRLIELLQ